MKVHHLADSAHADFVPVTVRMSVINSWKKKNSAEREISMSHGLERGLVAEDEMDGEDR